MRQIDANFARREPSMRVWFAAAALGLAVTAWQGQAAWLAWHSARSLDREVSALKTRVEAMRLPASEPAKSAKPSWPTDASVARSARFDWNAVLASIHATRVPGVRLTSLDVSAKDGHARIDLEAPRTHDILAYLAAINEESSPHWQLTRMQAASVTAPATATLEMLPIDGKR